MPAEAQNVPLHPSVLWAQRDLLVYLTISVEDMKIEDLTINEKSLHIKGASGSTQQQYECTLEFFGELNGTEYRRIESSRHVELVIPKATKGWWPRLLKDSKKVPWIKVDFNKWKDEDEEDDSQVGGPGGDGQFDLNSMMANLGGGGAGGMPPNLDDFEDSDNDDMPDLEDEPDEDEGKKANGPIDGQEPTTSGESIEIAPDTK